MAARWYTCPEFKDEALLFGVPHGNSELFWIRQYIAANEAQLRPCSHAAGIRNLLRLEPRGRFAERFGERAPQVLRRIAKVVSQERPTHISFVIRFDERKA